MKNLTIVILTFNEEANIDNCLDSIAAIDAPVFVVDSFSTDRTLGILQRRGVPYVQHEFKNYAAQRNWAQQNLPQKTEWVLHLDAGETMLPGMTRWINEDFDPHDPAVNGYMFPRRAVFLGKWMRFGGYHPIYHLRLYRRSAGRCEHKVYDQHFVVEGPTRKAGKGAHLADGVMSSLRDFTVSHARWAVFEAVELIISQDDNRQGGSGDVKVRLFGNPIERRRWFKNNVFQRLPLFVRSIFYFLHRYFIKLGILDGVRGLIFHVLQGFWFRFLVDATVYEIRLEMKHRPLAKIVAAKYGLDINKFLHQSPSDDGTTNHDEIPGSLALSDA